MNITKLTSLFGLKWNPFSAHLPNEALVETSKLEHFFWRVEEQAKEGGFALITGESGLGKSVALRMLNNKLTQISDIVVGEITRPQSSLWDFYCELSNLFGVEMKMNSRWYGYKILRERWQNHINTTMYRPVLLIDEAQEIPSKVLSEIRIMSSSNFDSKNILTVVFCGDLRLVEKFRDLELIPLGSRIKVRLVCETYSKQELLELLEKSISRAGAHHLMSSELKQVLTEHAIGNPRVMMHMANEILITAAQKELSHLDEKLFLEVFSQTSQNRKKTNQK